MYIKLRHISPLRSTTHCIYHKNFPPLLWCQIILVKRVEKSCESTTTKKSAMKYVFISPLALSTYRPAPPPNSDFCVNFLLSPDCTKRALDISFKQLQSISLMQPLNWCIFIQRLSAARCKLTCWVCVGENWAGKLSAIGWDFDEFTWLQHTLANNKRCTVVLIKLQ